MSANAAPIRSGTATSKGWFGAVSAKTRLLGRQPPTASAAVLLPEPGRPSINRTCGRGMEICIEMLDIILFPSILQHGADQCQRNPPRSPDKASFIAGCLDADRMRGAPGQMRGVEHDAVKSFRRLLERRDARQQDLDPRAAAGLGIEIEPAAEAIGDD